MKLFGYEFTVNKITKSEYVPVPYYHTFPYHTANLPRPNDCIMKGLNEISNGELIRDKVIRIDGNDTKLMFEDDYIKIKGMGVYPYYYFDSVVFKS